MKTNTLVRFQLVAVAFAIAFTAPTLPAQTTFSAYFNNGTGTGGDDDASLYNWSGALGAGGVLDATLASLDGASVGVSQGVTDTAGVPVVSGQSTKGGFLFALPNASPGVMMLFTTSLVTSDTQQDNPQANWFRNGPDSLSGLTLGSISQLSVYTRPATGVGLDMHFALEAGGSWYVSTTKFNQSDLNNYEQRTLNPGAGLWYANVFTPGSFLDDNLGDNATTSLNPFDLVTGYGWYVDSGTLSGTAARVRIDSFQVVAAVPEPASLSLLLLGGVGLLAARQRRFIPSVRG